MTLWGLLDSVIQFAGDEPEKAKYFPEDDDFLLEKEETSALYELLFEKLIGVEEVRVLKVSG